MLWHDIGSMSLVGERGGSSTERCWVPPGPPKLRNTHQTLPKVYTQPCKLRLGGIMASVTLDSRHLRILTRARDTLDEVIETLEILSDPEAMEAIREGERDIKAGRTKPFDELLAELKPKTEKGKSSKASERK